MNFVRGPWFATEPVDEQFFENAPVRLSKTFDIALPAERVWEDLVAEHPLSWCRILGNGISWTSPRPFGVGTTRTAKSMGGLSAIHESFFRWEEGRRQSFYALEINGPLFRRFAEDYLVEEAGDDACRFTWVLAYEPRGLARLAEPVNKRVLGTLFTDTRKHYASSASGA